MRYHDSELNIACQWGDGCKKQALSQVFSDDLTDFAWLCGFHKKVAVINLESYGKLHGPSSSRGKTSKPGQHQQENVQRPGTKSWEQEAAKKADEKAQPLDKEVVKGAKKKDQPKATPVITNLIKPKRPIK